MRLRPTSLALGLLLAFGSQAGFAQETAQKVLLEQALYWKSKGNGERAAEAWKKLLIINPSDARALYGLAKIEVDANRVDGAKNYIDKLKQADAAGRYVEMLQQDLSLRSPANEKLLYEARLLQEAGKPNEAVALYKKMFADKEPIGDIALEYYNFLGYSTNGFEPARRGLERLEKESPGDPYIALGMAKLLSRNGETRVTSIQQLARLSTIPSVQSEANEFWRKALIWLEQPRPTDAPLYDAYLKVYPDDAEIRKMRDGAVARLAEVGAGAGANSVLTAGFTALERGDREVAEAEFSKRLKEKPNDADALGGIGIIRLQQNKLEEAQQLIGRAVAQPGGQSWGVALGNVRYLRLVEEANSAQRDGDTARARNLYQQAARMDPKQSSAQLALAGLQVAAGEYDVAEKTYRAVLAQNKKDAVALSGLITVLALNNKLAAAQQLLQGVTPEQVGGTAQMNRLKASYSTGLSRAALLRGDPAKAVTELDSAMQNDRENPWIRLELAQTYLKQGQTAKARALFDSLSAGNQTDASVLFAGALLATQRRDWAGATSLLGRIPVKERSPEMVALQTRVQAYSELNLATNLAQQDRQVEALAVLTSKQSSLPKTIEFTGALASAYVDIGEPTRGLDLLRQAIAGSKQPEVELQLQYAALLLRTNQDAECSKILTAVSTRKLSTDEKRGFDDLLFSYSVRQADLLRERGDLTEASQRLVPLFAQRPSDIQVNAARARVFAASGQKDKALDVFKELVAKTPDSVELQLNVAQIATQVKENSIAAASLTKALELAPDDVEVTAAAAQMYRAQGRIAKAEELFERAMTLQGLPAPASPSDVSTRSPSRVAATALLAGRANSQGGQAPNAFSVRGDGPTTDPVLVAATMTSTKMTMATELDLIKQERAPELLIGLQVRNRNGTSGGGKLSDIEVPVEMRLPVGDGKLSLSATSVSLNAGAIGTDFYSRSTFGGGPSAALDQLAGLTGYPNDQTGRGVGWSLGYKKPGFIADIGVTPVGFQYSNVTGGIRFDGTLDQENTWYYSISGSSRPVVDSVLSFAGTRDSVTGQAWGAVMSTGARVQLSKDLGGYGVTGSAGLFSLNGHNVAANTRADANLGMYWNLIKANDENLTVSVYATSLFYNKNLSHYTYGQGGYFSPQQYYALTLPINWSQRSGDFSYRIGGALGAQKFSQSASDYFPNNGDLQAAANATMARLLASGGGGTGTATYEAQSQSGVAYNLSAAGEYQLNRYVFLGGLVQLDNSSNYRQWGTGLYLRFSFYPRTGPVLLPMSPYVSPYGL
ncbi:MAG: cellulose synthase subunit BcsC-related outer membrane protein [Alcaligenaceae bacterium]